MRQPIRCFEFLKQDSKLRICVLTLSATTLAVVILLDAWIHSSSRIAAFSDIIFMDVGRIGHIDFGSVEGQELSKFIETNPGLGSTYQHQWAVQLEPTQESSPNLATTDIIFSERINACVSLKNLSTVDVDVNVCPEPVGGQTNHSPPIVSFLIPLHNNARMACTCVCALFRTLTEVDGAELIIIDDGSTVDISPIVFVLNRLRFLFGLQASLRRLPQSVGFGKALNDGVTHASGKVACFLNADTVVVPGWLHPLMATFSTFKRAAIVGPMFLGLGNLITEAGGYVYANAQAGNYMRGFDPNFQVMYTRRVNYVSAACMAIRTDIFQRVGGFDEMYGRGYYEDTDLSVAVESKGWDVLYQPLSIVYHQEGSSFGADSPLKQYLMKMNKIKFYEKWREHLIKNFPQFVPPSEVAIQLYKKRILWVDDIVPEPDHDSGSIRTLHILRMLVDDGYHVTYQPNASGREMKYTLFAQFVGIQVLPFFDINHMTECHYDVVFVARRYVFERVRVKLQTVCRETPIVYDTVDLHFLRETRDYLSNSENRNVHANVVCDWLDSPAANGTLLRAHRDMELQFIRESRVAIVVSDVEASIVKRYLPDASIMVISNIFGMRSVKASRMCEDRNGVLFVGNFNHPPNQQGLRWFLENVFPLLGPMQERHPLHIVASNSISTLNEIVQGAGALNGNVIVHGYLTDNELHQLYMEVRAVIAPLLSGAGVKGKINQAMGYGVPVVATPIAIEAMHVQYGRDCLVSGNPTEFAILLRTVLDDCRIWKEIVSNALINVQTFFSLKVAHARLTSVLHLCNA